MYPHEVPVNLRKTNFPGEKKALALLEVVVKTLNEMLSLDKEATKALVNFKAPANLALAEHPEIQVHQEEGETGKYSVGMVGVLAGVALKLNKTFVLAYGTNEKGDTPVRFYIAKKWW